MRRRAGLQVVGSCWEDSEAAVGDSVAYMQICVCGVGAANVFSRTTKVACADVAQLVAHHLAKVRVASSSLVIRSGITFGTLNVSGFPVLRWNGRVVRQRSAKPCTRVQFPFPPLVKKYCAFSSAGERFPDTEEVTGSIPVSRTVRM